MTKKRTLGLGRFADPSILLKVKPSLFEPKRPSHSKRKCQREGEKNSQLNIVMILVIEVKEGIKRKKKKVLDSFVSQ
jgi:hypothetical protein